ncbi:MAG: hypothetical protein ACE15C_14815 [Phycisphaerae bacterium]
MAGMTLLEEARSVGLEVRTEGNDLVVRGPRDAGHVARKLLAEKAATIEAVKQEQRREHRAWLDSLTLDDRLQYDRAFGKAWFEGRHADECRRMARQRVMKLQHRGTNRDLRGM